MALGDRNDSVDVNYSRPGTVVSGGRGDDRIESSGRISGGPGADEIYAREWSRTWITGGPGDDTITADHSKGVIDAGAGMDSVDSGGVVRTRDGQIDYVDGCHTAYIDALDMAECRHVQRRGAARALPEPNPVFDNSATTGDLSVYCPEDGPRTCAGVVIVTRGQRTFLRRRFKIRREYPDSSDYVDLPFRTSRAEMRAMHGRLRVTVRSRDRAGKSRTASGTYAFPPE